MSEWQYPLHEGCPSDRTPSFVEVGDVTYVEASRETGTVEVNPDPSSDESGYTRVYTPRTDGSDGKDTLSLPGLQLSKDHDSDSDQSQGFSFD